MLLLWGFKTKEGCFGLLLLCGGYSWFRFLPLDVSGLYRPTSFRFLLLFSWFLSCIDSTWMHAYIRRKPPQSLESHEIITRNPYLYRIFLKLERVMKSHIRLAYVYIFIRKYYMHVCKLVVCLKAYVVIYLKFSNSKQHEETLSLGSFGKMLNR